MDLPPEIKETMSNSNGFWIGFIAALLTGGYYGIRRIIRGDKISGADTRAALNSYQRLYDLLDAERKEKVETQARYLSYITELHKLLDEANQRAEKANRVADVCIRDKNELLRDLREVEARIRELEAENRIMREVYRAKPDEG